jgi:hypothetical protein
MRKGLCLGLIVALILSARSLDAQVPNFYHGPAPAYSPLVRAAFRALLSGPAFFFNPQADGGGDSGGSDGGSGDGSSSDGSSTDGSSSSAGGDAAAAAAAAAAAEDAVAVDVAVATDEAPTTDPTTVNTQESPLDAIQAIATTDPRGGEEVSPASTNGGVAGGPDGVAGGAGGAVPPAGGSPPAAPVDVAINAVIVSGANSPWGAVQRAPGVRNVTVTGGIIALGKTPLPGEPPPGSPQPAWLRVVPDLRLLDGSVIPPVVPNIIDIRWLNCPIEVIENPGD